ncbi:MAG: hypothetical protein RI924_1143 [Bacteroidota bacterium]|jgi:glycerophosphoryl diester phosphodiesterase
MRTKLTSIFVLLALSLSKLHAQPKNLDFQGHRGCRGLYPENTIPAMIEALKLGVTTLELDVVITKDKQVVLSHEPFMAHEISTSAEGNYLDPEDEKKFNIYQMNFEELKRWDVGMKVHPRFPNQVKMATYKPLLGDVIDSVEQFIKTNRLKAVNYNIETKTDPEGDLIFHPEPAEFVELLWEVIEEKQIQERVIIQSFDKRTIQYVHQQKLPVKLSFLLEESNVKTIDRQLANLGFKPDFISPEFSKIDPKFVRHCHKKGIKVIPWTVNEPAAISKLIDMGVDGIITDYPNLFQLVKN